MYKNNPVQHTILVLLGETPGAYVNTRKLYKQLRARGFAKSPEAEFSDAIGMLYRADLIELNHAHPRSKWYRLTAKGSAQVAQ